jgi:hypothetical protein
VYLDAEPYSNQKSVTGAKVRFVIPKLERAKLAVIVLAARLSDSCDH